MSKPAVHGLALAWQLALLGTVARPAAAQSAADVFLRELRAEVHSGNRSAVVARVRFPIVVRMAGVRIPFADPSAFLQRYDDIFTPAMLDAIARPQPAATGPSGFVVGTNAIIVTQIAGRFRITEINVPPVGNTAAAGRAKAPARVGIRGGPRPTQFSGLLEPGGVDTYLLFVAKGRRLEARLERVRGREALVHVVHAISGAPLNPRTASGARIVSGMPAEGADYRIEVRRGESADTSHLPYILSLSLK